MTDEIPGEVEHFQDSQKGRELHAQAATARELQHFRQSLHFNNLAIQAYKQDGDLLGQAEGLACRAITLRVEAGLDDDKKAQNLDRANGDMLEAVEIARASGRPEALPLPLYNLAQVQEDRGELDKAIQNYREAIERKEALERTPLKPDEEFHPSAQLLNMKINLAVCEYKNGDESGEDRAEEALRELDTIVAPDAYADTVWKSGADMKLAGILKDKNPEIARNHLEKAYARIQAHIGKDERLKLRERQWQKLAATFNQSS